MIVCRDKTFRFAWVTFVAAVALAEPTNAQSWQNITPEVRNGIIKDPTPNTANSERKTEQFPSPQNSSNIIDWVLRPDAQDANQTGGSEDNLLQELIDLVDTATSANAADTRFLGDLRRLIRKYDSMRGRGRGTRYGGNSRGTYERILFDDFGDGDFTRNPSWRASGDGFEVSAGYGLRTKVLSNRSSFEMGSGETNNIAGTLFGTVLNQVQRRRGDQTSRRNYGLTAQPQLTLSALVPSIFTVEILVRSDSAADRLEFGVVQGREAYGYRLTYNPGSNQLIQVLKVGVDGVSLLDAVSRRHNFDGNRTHKIQLARDAAGRTTVSLDGQEVTTTTDRSIPGNFDGLIILNHGGDYTIRSVSVYGAN